MNQAGSPPPEAKPTSSAPGERARKLRDVYARALKNALKPVSQYPNFAACFPTPARYCEGALRDLHSDFVRRLGATCEAEFEALLHERDVVPSLNQLDEQIDDARARKTKAERDGDGEVPIPPHLLEPGQLLQLHLQRYVDGQSAKVEMRLEETEAANKQLAEEISAQRAEIDALLSGFENVVNDLEGANHAFRGDEMNGVAEILKG